MRKQDIIMLICLTFLFTSILFLIWNNEIGSLTMAIMTLIGTVDYEIIKENKEVFKWSEY